MNKRQNYSVNVVVMCYFQGVNFLLGTTVRLKIFYCPITIIIKLIFTSISK